MVICDNCKHLMKDDDNITTGTCFDVVIEDTTVENECPHFIPKDA